MDETDAKRLATEMAARLSDPIRNIDASHVQAPLTLLDILRLGFMFAKIFRQANPSVKDKFPVSPDLLAAFLAVPHDPTKLRDVLYDGLKKSDEDPTALEDEVELISANTLRRGARKEFNKALREAWPPEPPGSDRKIESEAVPKLAERADRLRPVLIRLLDLQQQFPTKQWEELINFLHTDHPRECTYLKFRVERLPRMVELPVYSKAKTIKSKARILADLLVGSDFELGPRYARQKAEEARRIVNGKQRKRIPRPPKLD